MKTTQPQLTKNSAQIGQHLDIYKTSPEASGLIATSSLPLTALNNQNPSWSIMVSLMLTGFCDMIICKEI